MKRNIREVKKRLEKIRKLAANMPSPFSGMSLEAAITKMRKVREELWERKFATRP